ncbi:MAG: hypothetical protein D3917_18325 [Candidatus Electrothrix sp. AX5]|jgi:hypothetical protein|uniref:Uncharacterized protein n=1 Tax=Candidatus Electrothrix aarhusensis TaxID=1859131 RepID=A0A3S3RM84_9BACT|nr:hypothetical protein [Candidatus Electrothrix sp. AX5]RWX43054.1 hypothetical protein H206_03180 [Candidatus Electrothrix aarhusensis]
MKFISPLLFFIGMIGVVTLGNNLYADLMLVFYGDHDIYWTHKDMLLPLEKTGNSFTVYVGEKPLQDHLNGKTFFAADGELVPYPVLAKDVTVRLNNWPSVKAEVLTRTTFTGFAFGVTLMLMIGGLVRTCLACLQQKKKAGNHPRA